MKQIVIVTGILILFLLIIAWMYLLLFGAPQGTAGIFADLGLRGGPTEITANIDTTAQLAPPSGALTQLTTRSVAGFVHIPASTSTPARLRYAERGTGHIYEINLDGSTENRVSGTTVGQTVGAMFDHTGTAAVLVAEEGDTVTAMLYGFGSNTTRTVPLPANSRNFHFASPNILRYSVIEGGDSVAYEQNWLQDTISELWRVPLTDIRIIWTDNDAFVVNRTAPYLKGGVYRVQNGGLQRVVPAGYALSAVIDPGGRFVLTSAFSSDARAVMSGILDRDTAQTFPSALPAIPEKCVFVTGKFWCASSFQLMTGGRESLNAWYKGEFISSDTFWKQGDSEGTAEYVVWLSDLAGFDIDVIDLSASDDGETLFFRNKTNDTLWMYKIGEE